jgi:Tfp pilus assembly protein PilF
MLGLLPCQRRLAVFLFLPFLFHAEFLAAQLSGGSIVGQVRVAPGTELPKVILVNLEARGTVVNSVYTDSEGRFGFNNLPGNIYHIKIEDEDYYPITETVVVDPESSATRLVNIFVNPRSGRKAAEPAVQGGNPHLTSSAELKRLFPVAAWKEFDAGVKADAKQDTDSAIKHYEKALKIAPDIYPARNNLGTAYLSKGMAVPAREQFERAVGLNANDAAAYFNLGNLHYLQKDYTEANDWIDQGLSREPASAFGHFLKGSVSTAMGDFVSAEKELRRSLELDAKLAKAHLALVNLYLRQQKKDEAKVELQGFLKAFPDDPLAAKAEEVLKRLEK